MRNMLRTDANLWGGAQERKLTDQIKKIKDIKEDEERLKGQEKMKIENTCIFIQVLLSHTTKQSLT